MMLFDFLALSGWAGVQYHVHVEPVVVVVVVVVSSLEHQLKINKCL